MGKASRKIKRTQARAQKEISPSSQLVTTIQFNGTYDAQRGIVTMFEMSMPNVDPSVVLRLGQSIEAQAFALVVSEWNATRQQLARLQARSE